MKDAKVNDKNLYDGINQSNLVIGIKLLMAQSDPINRHPLYYKFFFLQKWILIGITLSIKKVFISTCSEQK